VAIVKRRLWRNRIRGQLKEVAESLTAITRYQSQHPTYPFLDPATATAIAVVQAWVTLKLSQTSIP
jgi:hypothetical protein